MRRTQFNVTSAAGPFKVTSPNTAVTWSAGAQTVTWDVASTDAAPVSCANVNIDLSTDGGLTFPTSLAAGTPNDGTEIGDDPAVTTSTARIKVACAGSIFFDISDANFAIGASLGPVVATGAASAIAATGATLNGTVSSNGATTTVTFQYGLTTGYGSTATAAQSPLASGASGVGRVRGGRRPDVQHALPLPRRRREHQRHDERHRRDVHDRGLPGAREHDDRGREQRQSGDGGRDGHVHGHRHRRCADGRRCVPRRRWRRSAAA